MKCRMIYKVEGWDGDPVCFTTKWDAREELVRRENFIDYCECIEEEENGEELYYTLKGYDNDSGEMYYLTLESIPLYEEEEG